MKWISVKDRLPELDKPILIFNGQIVVAVCKFKRTYNIKRFNFYYNHDQDLLNQCGGNLPNVYDVTHWMPLPEEPFIDPNEPIAEKQARPIYLIPGKYFM